MITQLKFQAAAMFVNFSDILKKDVRDRSGAYVGRVWDIAAMLGEVYPKSCEIIVSKGFFRRTYACAPWSAVAEIDDDIMLNIPAADLSFSREVKPYEFLLKRDILDQQVVDTFNHKVRRVNDVHLLKVDHELVVAHVDIGLRGLLRRLDWEKPVDLLVGAFRKEADYLRRDEIVSWKYVQPVAINPASMTMKLAVAEKQIMSIPAVDLGDIIFDLNANQRIALFRALDLRTKAKVFENLEFDEQKTILKELDKKEIAQIVNTMSSDEAADLLEKLPQDTVKNLLTLVESNRAKKLSTLLGFASDSAGGIMTAEFVGMPETMAVEAALDYIKTQTRDYDVVPYIYILDEKNRLKGVTTIRRLLFADPKDTILKTAFPKTLHVYLNNSVKEVAYLMDRYKVSAIAVIDEEKVMHGIITMDDILSQVISIAWRRRPKITQGL